MVIACTVKYNKCFRRQIIYQLFLVLLFTIFMGGRLPANRTFLELSAGQSDWPEKKLRGSVTKKAQETCFVLPRRKAIFPMDSPLSQHKKRSLPSDIRYFPFALVNYPVTPTLT